MATSEGGCFSHRIVSLGRRQNSRQPGCFVGAEFGSGFPEVMPGRGFCAIYAPSPFGDVEIQFENALFRQMVFERSRNQRFPRFSEKDRSDDR